MKQQEGYGFIQKIKDFNADIGNTNNFKVIFGELPLTNCQVELKLEWTKYLVQIMLTIEILIILFVLPNTQNYSSNFISKRQSKLSKFLSNEFARSTY